MSTSTRKTNEIKERASSTENEDNIDRISSILDNLTLSPNRATRLRPTWTLLERPRDWLEGMPRVGFIYDPVMEVHKELGHVECPGRISTPYETLRKRGTIDQCFKLEPRAATVSELCLFHTKAHVANVHSGNIGRRDVYWCEESTMKSAAFSAGCTLDAMEAVLNGNLDNAFALVRPPGHHADRETAQGFCFFNNVAIAALKAMEKERECERVLILDWDVHHGNGIQNAFYDNPSVLYISIHRGGHFYPQTGELSEIGEGNGMGYNVNIPWPGGGFGDADYLAAFEAIVEPIVTAFSPNLILVSAGFDAVEHDPLGELCVTPACFAHLTKRLLEINSKTVLVLEGGYNLLQLSDCIDQCMRVLLGEDPEPLATDLEMQRETKQILSNVADQLSSVWPTLENKQFEQRMESIEKELSAV